MDRNHPPVPWPSSPARMTGWQAEKGTDVVFEEGSSAAVRHIGGSTQEAKRGIDGAAAGDWVTH
jgi:hypothetical protein